MTLSQGHRIVALAAAALLAAAGCSSKAPGQESAATAEGEVRTGPGVEGDTITLGVLTDLTGVFATIAADLTNGETLYWEQQNAQGGVCGKYQVELDVKDTGYVVQNAVQLYSGMKDGVLAMQQTAGSPSNTALLEQYEADKIVNVPFAFARNLAEWEGNALPGATYDVEMVNGLSYMLDKGLLKKGDTIGHLYFEGEYGSNALAGSMFMAEKHGLTLVEAKIKPTDADMTPQIVQFKSAGVDLIVLTTAGTQTASVASVTQSQGLDVPILGSSPVYSPGLLAGPAGDKLREDLYVAAPLSTFDQHPELLKAYQEKFPGTTPSVNALLGYGSADVLRQVLDRACENGDLTREGVVEAKGQLDTVETGGVLAPLDYTEAGGSPTRQNFVLRPATAPGGLTVEQQAFEGADTAEFISSVTG